MEKRKMAQKKFESARKKDLEYLVEEFLEKNWASIAKHLKKKAVKAHDTTVKLNSILFKETFWMDELYEEDLEGTDFVRVLYNSHSLLKPLWNQIKKALFDYKEKIIPARTTWKENRQHPVQSELIGVLPYEPSEMVEKFYKINLRSGATSHVTLCFDAGKIDITNRDYSIKNNFLALLKGVPISLFGKCMHCGKVIVITRINKKHCPGCAAKAIQEEKWKKNPVESREKEKRRYHEKRKRPSR
jgi:hypothetical protein